MEFDELTQDIWICRHETWAIGDKTDQMYKGICDGNKPVPFKA